MRLNMRLPRCENVFRLVICEKNNPENKDGVEWRRRAVGRAAVKDAMGVQMYSPAIKGMGPDRSCSQTDVTFTEDLTGGGNGFNG